MFRNSEKQRKVIEKTYTDICNIYNFEKILKGSITTNEKVMAYENIKCCLSQKALRPANQSSSKNTIDYEIKLFISPDIDIKPGAEVEIIHCGNIYTYNQTGEAFIYQTHQEVILKKQTRA